MVPTSNRSCLPIATKSSFGTATMGKAKKTRKFAVAKKIISPKDTRVRENLEKEKQKQLAEKAKKEQPRHVEQANTALFFQHNTQLGPPYHVLVDTNFINFSIRCVILRIRK
jgi:U3 small nucleolar RNA-associated protein 24